VSRPVTWKSECVTHVIWIQSLDSESQIRPRRRWKGGRCKVVAGAVAARVRGQGCLGFYHHRHKGGREEGMVGLTSGGGAVVWHGATCDGWY
jgi:hypothetical protein